MYDINGPSRTSVLTSFHAQTHFCIGGVWHCGVSLPPAPAVCHMQGVPPLSGVNGVLILRLPAETQHKVW